MASRRVLSLLAIVGGVALTLSFACSSEYSGGGPAADAGQDDAAIVDAPARVDAANGDAGAGGDAGECTAAKAPSCAPATCERRKLHESVGGYPWGLATDASHVFWIEQRAPGDAYNGFGRGTIYRTTRKGTDPVTPLATDQLEAQAIAVVGGHVYWSTYETVGNGLQARFKRVSTTCVAPCMPEDVTGPTGIAARRVTHMYPFGSAELLVIAFETMFRFVPGQGSVLIVDLGAFPHATVTGAAGYLTAAARSDFIRVPVGSSVGAPGPAIPPLDAGAVAAVATDCFDLFAIRGPQNELWRAGVGADALAPGPRTVSGDVFDLGADARWIYAGVANGGGLYAIDPASGISTSVLAGNVFRLAVDDTGVFWGDHGGSGAVWMMVK